MNLYEGIAKQYDLMTNFDRRINKTGKVMQKWMNKYSFDSTLDTATGTGVYAIVLALAGKKAIGTDSSEAMIKKARENAARIGADVKWIVTRMEELDLGEKFDSIMCMGNSLPHIHPREELNRTLDNLKVLLKNEGQLIIQLLNYKKILKDKQRIVNITRSGKTEFIRFYDFILPYIRFNILKVQEEKGKISYDLNSADLYPYTEEYLVKTLQETGFGKIETFGNMEFAAYEPFKSPNLVLVAKP